MKRSNKIFLGLIAVIAVAAIAVVAWLFVAEPEKELTVVTQDIQNQQVLEPKSKTSNKKALVEEEEEFNPYESEAFKANIQQVADIFEENSKYPTNSQPIYDPDSVKEPEPYQFTEVDLPFPENDGDENPIRIAAATDTYQYFVGDVIRLRVRLTGAPKDTFAEVKGVLSGSSGDIPIALNFDATDKSLTEFNAEFDTKLAPLNLLTPEMLAKISVTVDDRDLFTTVTFRVDQPSARVVGVLPARPEGPNLVIPLQVNVDQGGYYFMRSVLQDANTRLPLIELQTEGRLQLGNGILTFKAHIAALKRQQSEGPYVLRSVKLHRGAEAGETYDRPGSSSLSEYTIQGFPFSAYTDEEYSDEQTQERLDFLRDLGDIDDETENLD